MHRDIRFDTVESFISAMKDIGISKIVYAVVKEKRSIQKSPEKIEVEPVYTGEALAYKNAVIYRFTAHGNDVDTAECAITAAGFECTRKNRNIT
ncbi:MAG: hypothetical protein ACRCUT_01620 [Spirochaetota bacterium]